MITEIIRKGTALLVGDDIPLSLKVNKSIRNKLLSMNLNDIPRGFSTSYVKFKMPVNIILYNGLVESSVRRYNSAIRMLESIMRVRMFEMNSKNVSDVKTIIEELPLQYRSRISRGQIRITRINGELFYATLHEINQAPEICKCSIYPDFLDKDGELSLDARIDADHLLRKGTNI